MLRYLFWNVDCLATNVDIQKEFINTLFPRRRGINFGKILFQNASFDKVSSDHGLRAQWCKSVQNCFKSRKMFSALFNYCLVIHSLSGPHRGQLPKSRKYCQTPFNRPRPSFSRPSDRSFIVSPLFSGQQVCNIRCLPLLSTSSDRPQSYKESDG